MSATPFRLSPGNPQFQAARIAERCRISLYKFIREAWPIVDPKPYVDHIAIGAIAEHLQAVSNREIRKLIINCPPGVAKSICTSVMWPAWEWIDRPSEQSLFGSYDINLALRDSAKCRNLFTSDWYQYIFQPEWRLDPAQNAKGFYVNTLRGNRYTFGTGAGGQTGWRGNKVVLDDPNNVKHQFDARVKLQTYDDFNSITSTRVNDILNSCFVIIQQRMATDDMTGMLLAENEASDNELMNRINELIPFEWVHLKLPMVATAKACVTVIGWQDPRKSGELLCPELFPQPAVDYMRYKKLGEHGYAGQYQQEPIPEGGNRFDKSFFQHWYSGGHGIAILHRRLGTKEVIQFDRCWTFVTVDFAASEEQQADFTVFSIWAVTEKFDMLLLDVRRGQWGEPTILKNAMEIYESDAFHFGGGRHVCYVVEDNGLGKPIAQAMIAKGLPVLPVHIHRDKFVRSATAKIRLEAGQIFWPDPKTPWYSDPIEGWEIELTRFPAFAHDDQVDTFSLAAEAVYEADIGVLREIDVLDKQVKEVVDAMERRNVLPGKGKHVATRFFGANRHR